jgi:hypothetical protein
LLQSLTAAYDTEGRPALIDEFGAHRGASLFLGRNEECGIRCSYHGWKYDLTNPMWRNDGLFKKKLRRRTPNIRQRSKKAISTGSELGRQIAVDLEPDAGWCGPDHMRPPVSLRLWS